MVENTSTVQNGNAALPRWAWAIAVLLTVLAYFLGLTLPLVGPDEPRYAQVAREMYERGDWITPTLGGTLWFEKPALLYWLEIVSYRVFGVSEFAARLGPAMFGLGTVAALWVLGRRVSRETQLADWLALVAASTLGIIVFSHGASFDILITFPLTGALVCFYLAVEGDGGDTKIWPLVFFYVFIGVALLAKGLIGIVFPLATAVLYLVLRRRLPAGRVLASVVWGIPLAAAVAAAWYLPMYMRHGAKFVDEFIIQHHFQRFLSNKYQHPQPFYFFLWILPLMTLPWLPFVLGGVSRLGSKWKMENGEWRIGETGTSGDLRSLSLFAIAWIVVPLVFFSFSGSKLPGYVLPAVPGASLLAGIFVYQLVGRHRRWGWPMYSIGCLVLVICCALLVAVVPKYAANESVRDLMMTATNKGFGSERVYSLHTISHNAEFYAAGRLLRDPEGQQKKLYGPAEVVTEMQRAGVTEALVLVPDKHLDQIVGYPPLRAEVVADNGELSLVQVERPIR